MRDKNLETLILENQNLIYSIAKKFKGEIEDLFQAGCIGLIYAYKNYNDTYLSKFTTYAYPYIFGEIYKYVLNNKSIKISSDVIKLNTAIKKAHDYLSQKLKREPNDMEIASFLEIPVNKIMETRNSINIASLDDNPDNLNFSEIADEKISKDELILLRDALNKLNDSEKELIIKRYFYNMTQSEIAKQIGVNQVKVSREEGKVLTKLKNYM